MSPTDPTHIAERYVAMWNEPDAARRRTMVADLWAEGGRQILQPPAEMRRESEELGFAEQVLEARGHRALEYRVGRSFDMFVTAGGFRFRRRGDVTASVT